MAYEETRNTSSARSTSGSMRPTFDSAGVRAVLAFGLGLTTAFACKSQRLNPDHCFNTRGDEECAAKYPDGSRPFCGKGTCFPDVEDGCVEERPADDECYSPCGGREDFTAESTCLVAGDDDDDDDDATVGDDDDDDTGPDDDDDDATGPDDDDDDDDDDNDDDDTTGSGPCRDNDECTEPDAPFCLSEGTCGPCGETSAPNGSCATESRETPVCVDNECVECDAENFDQCLATAQVCNDNTNECEDCTAHSQCQGAAGCNIPDGACGLEENVFYVDGDAKTCDDGGDGSEATPFCAIQAGVDAAGALEDGVIAAFYVTATVTPYFETPVIGAGEVVLLLASDPNDPPVVQGSGSATFTVQAGATLVLDHFTVNLNGTDPGVSSTNAALHVDGCRITQNTGGGIVASGSSVRLVNTIIGGNGFEVAPTAGLDVTEGTTTVQHTTFALNTGNIARSIACTDPVATTIRDSIMVAGTGDSVDCAGTTIETSAADSALGGTNTNVGPAMGGWFVNPLGGDYHLTSGAAPNGEGVFEDLAEWNTGDPSTDIDGDARPAIDGAADFPGADVPG